PVWKERVMETTKTHIVHGGTLRYLKHDSTTTGTPMTLSVFVPAGPDGDGKGPFPVLIWLSGLTCTEDKFTTKPGAYKPAADQGRGVQGRRRARRHHRRARHLAARRRRGRRSGL